MEKDLGVLVDCRLSNSAQCHAVVAKANKILSCIKGAMDGREVNIIMQLYKALVRPHLEYGAQFWGPLLRKDILELERVQRIATKLIKGMDNLSYEERLAKLDTYFQT
ncbi:hypothetical protein FKM82_026144 [Ascaphus truei]